MPLHKDDGRWAHGENRITPEDINVSWRIIRKEDKDFDKHTWTCHFIEFVAKTDKCPVEYTERRYIRINNPRLISKKHRDAENMTREQHAILGNKYRDVINLEYGHTYYITHQEHLRLYPHFYDEELKKADKPENYNEEIIEKAHPFFVIENQKLSMRKQLLERPVEYTTGCSTCKNKMKAKIYPRPADIQCRDCVEIERLRISREKAERRMNDIRLEAERKARGLEEKRIRECRIHQVISRIPYEVIQDDAKFQQLLQKLDAMF